MVLNILVIVLTGVIALMWGLRGKGRGFFSAFLALVCTVISGAVAFAAWEPLAYGVFLGMKEDLAWGLALLAPFVVTLIVTRLLVELVIPKNVRLGDAENFIGGFICGAGNGIITMGIAVLAVSFYSGGPELAGYKPLEGDRGNLVYKKPLWFPVDKLTVSFYEMLSLHAFSTPTPMALRAPRLYEQAAMSRQVFTRDEEGKRVARTTILPEQFRVEGHYTVTEVGEPIVYPDGGSPREPQAHGFVIEFRTQAGEQGSGQILIGNGQVRLVARSNNGQGDSVIAVHPYACIGMRPDELGLHRWLFDAEEVFIGSVGGADSTVFALEFALPSNYLPTDLFIKNVRVPLITEGLSQPNEASQYASASARNRAVEDGTLFTDLGVSAGATEMVLDLSNSLSLSPDGSGWVKAFPGLPENFVLSRVQGTGSLLTQDRLIRSGTATFPMERLTNRTVPTDQRVDSFASTNNTTIVQVELASRGTFTSFGDYVAQGSDLGQPVLVDENNRAYPAIGYVYADDSTVTISYSPSDPLENLRRFPNALSIARGNQTAYLIFRPTSGVNLTGFGFRGEGNDVTIAVEFNPPMKAGR